MPKPVFLGDDLLVAPITEPGIESWPVYLARGE
jgi:alpha-glucosidase (family GH31 glycosyl hydrolase)